MVGIFAVIAKGDFGTVCSCVICFQTIGAEFWAVIFLSIWTAVPGSAVGANVFINIMVHLFVG